MRSPARPRWASAVVREPGLRWTLGCALVTLLVVTLPQTLHWDAVLGSPLGETDNHLWMFWRASQRLLGRTEALGNAPVGVAIPLMDPVNLPAYLAGAWISPAVGWRCLASWNVGLAMLGSYLLARQWTHPDGARVAMVAAGAAPFLGGVLDFGITESWTLGWFTLHAAALVAYGRTGRRGLAVAAGVCLGAVALSGWYHAFYGVLLEAMLVPAVWLWRRRAGVVLQGGIGLVMVLPSLWAFLPHRASWEPRWRVPSPGPPGPRPDWGELPVFGVDLLTFVVPHPEVVTPSKATYLGLVMLALVVVGVVRRPRRTLGLVGLSLPFLVLALGYWPSIGGKAWGAPGPARWLVDAVPELMGMSHWFRATGPAAVLLAVAAGVGAGSLCRGRPGWSVGLCGLVLLDSVVGAPTAWPRAAYRIDVPASILHLAGEGGLVQLPFDNGRKDFTDTPPRLYNRWQVGHGRAVSENYEGVDALLASSELVAPIDAACLLSTTLPPYYHPPPEMRGLGTPSARKGPALAAELATQGFDWIVLHRDRCPVTATPIRALDKALGRPGIELPGGDRAWPLRPGLEEETRRRLGEAGGAVPR